MLNELIDIFPFVELDDDEFPSLFLGDCSNIDYQSFYFNHYDSYGNLDEIQPDNMFSIDVLHSRRECNYCSLQEYNRMNSEYLNMSISVLFSNIRSIPKNLEEFCLDFNVQTGNIDIIGFAESWLREDIEPLYLVGGYQMFANSRSTRGGGVVLYVRSNYSAAKISSLSLMLPHMESLFLKTVCKGHVLIVGVIYRPPCCNRDEFLIQLHELLGLLSQMFINTDVMILGDFNVNLLNLSSGSFPFEYLTKFLNSGFHPLILRPTRVHCHAATLIDQVWINNIDNVVNSGVILSTISDHFPIYSNICLNTSPDLNDEYIYYTKRVRTPTAILSLNNAISSMDWSSFLNVGDVNLLYDGFVDRIDFLYNKFCPNVTRKVKSSFVGKSYIDDVLKDEIEEKHRLQRLFCKWPISYRDSYTEQRNKVNSLVRSAKKRHFQEKLVAVEGDSHKSWDILNSLLGRSRPKSASREFLIEQRITCDESVIAEEFNNFFSTIGEKLASAHQNTPDFTQYLQRVPDTVRLIFTPATTVEIKKLVSAMKLSSAGHDGLPLSVFRDNIEALCDVLCHMCNLSMSTGVFPDKMKIARVCCVYKSGEPNLVKNYRPISVLPVLSKLLERVVTARITDHFVSNNLLTEFQFGFRQKHTVENAIHKILTDIYSDFNNGEYGLGVFVDLSKAFDTLDRVILLEKLEFYGVKDVELRWVQSYFFARQQYVVFEEGKSSISNVNCGVPQGSIIGPLMFIIYINDIINSSNVAKYVMFADDTNIFMSSSNLRLLYNTMNSEMAKICKWFSANKLTLNTDKTQYMIFHRHKKKIHPETISDLYVNGNKIKRVSVTKFLGVWMDENLVWGEHVRQVVLKVSKYLFVFRKIRPLLQPASLKLIYHTLIYPNLMYCLTVWGNCTNVVKNPVIILQKKLVRAMCGSAYLEHTAPLFEQLKFLTFPNLITYSCGLYVYRSINNLYATNNFQTYHNMYNTRLTAQNVLVTNFSNTNHSKQSIMCSGPAVWNQIPSEIRQIENCNTFKFNFKRHLISHQ